MGIDDHYPEFNLLIHNISGIREDIETGTAIYRMEATDLDEGDNSEIVVGVSCCITNVLLGLLIVITYFNFTYYMCTYN